MDSKISKEDMANEIKRFLCLSDELNDNLTPFLDYKFTLQEIIGIIGAKGQAYNVADIPSEITGSFIGIENQDDARDNIRALAMTSLIELLDYIISEVKASDLDEQNDYRIME